jgi:hypothetical protein
MKAIVLTLLSCVLLGGVYGILNKKSQVSNLLSFTSKTGAALPLGADDPEKPGTAAAVTSSHKADTSNTLNDSHWLDDEAFQKAVEAEQLLNNAETNKEVPHAPQLKAQDQQEPVPSVRNLILELNPDTTTARQAVPVEVV